MAVPGISGVPQGLVLVLTLFLIFINGLTDSIRSSLCLSADDCVLCRNIYSRHDYLILQEDIANLKPQLHCHDFGHGGATTHPDLSSRDASA